MNKNKTAKMTGFFIIFMSLATFTCPLYGELLRGGQTQFLLASYYSTASLKQEGTYAYSGGKMANGKLFSDASATCACNSYKLGAVLRVTNLSNGRSVVVINSDHTAKRFKGKRIDLSLAAMREIDGVRRGLVPVIVERIGAK